MRWFADGLSRLVGTTQVDRNPRVSFPCRLDSAQKIGYDIASLDPRSQHLRFIEVKGRIDGADTVMITRQEVITSLHEPEKFILAVVEVENGFARAPRYVHGALDDREPRFDQSAIQYDLRRLLERAKEPA